MKVDKVWGHEEIIINNEKYCGKILYLKKGYFSSLHYHGEKDETFFILEGRVKIEVSGELEKEGQSFEIIKDMKVGEIIHLPPNTIHRFTGLEDSKIIEFSTHHEDSDTFRIEKSGKT